MRPLPKHREEEAERKLALMDAEFALPGEAATTRPDYRGCCTAAEADWVRKGGDLDAYRRMTDTKAQAAQRQAFASTPGLTHLPTHVPAEDEQAMLKAGLDPKYAGVTSMAEYREVRDRRDRLDAASPDPRFIPVSRRECSPQLAAAKREHKADLDALDAKLARLAT